MVGRMDFLKCITRLIQYYIQSKFDPIRKDRHKKAMAYLKKTNLKMNRIEFTLIFRRI